MLGRRLAGFGIAVWVGCTSGPVPLDQVDADRDGATADVDCDDADPFVHPGAVEFCDGYDDDCDGEIDEAGALGERAWYPDADGDGYGVRDAPAVTRCDPALVGAPGMAPFPTDCDDAAPSVHPRRDDPCNGVDDDCSGVADDHPSERWFVDADGDGHGAPEALAGTLLSCNGTAPVDDDCDDADPDTYPGAPERCDGADNDCDFRDDSLEVVTDPLVWYADLDGDGYGVEGVTLTVCVPPTTAWATAAGDCDDLDPTAHPGALQLCVARDTDCDGAPGDVSGWYAPDATARITLDVVGTGAPTAQPALAEVDFRAALDALGDPAAFDADTVTVAVQDCAADAGRALPAAVVDGLADPFAPIDPAATVGDERALVTFVLDAPLGAGEHLPVAVYFGGTSAGDRPGSASTTATALTAGDLTLDLDPDRGGAIEAWSSAGVRVFSQADARAGNGLFDAGAWTPLGPGTTEVLADTPAFGMVHADAVQTGTAGEVHAGAWVFAFDGVPVTYVHLLLEATSDLTWSDPAGGDPRLGVVPFELVPLDLVAPVATNGPGYAALADDVAGAALVWARPPADPASLACRASGCTVAGSEGQGSAGAALAGEVLVRHRVLAVVPVAGTGIDTATLDAARTLPSVAIGTPESR